MEDQTPPQPQTENTSSQILSSLRKPLIQYLLMYLAVMCVYVPTFWYTFIWDDWEMIARNESLREWNRIPDYFTDPSTFMNPQEVEVVLEYRPVRNVYYLVTYKMHGLHPTGWHFNHVLIHSLAAALVLALFHRVYRYAKAWPLHNQLPPALQWAAWLSVFAWAVHPANTEVTAWLKSADDILSVIFACIALMILFPSGKSLAYPRAIAGALFLIPALLTKASVAPVPLIYVALIFVLSPDLQKGLRHKPNWLAATLLFLLLAGFMVLRKAMLGQLEQVPYMAGSFSHMMATMTTAVVRYLQLTFWPFWPTVQMGDYINWPLYRSWSDPAVISNTCILAAVTVTIALVSRRSKVFLAGWLFAVIAFTPAANIIPMMQVMAERFMYFPLIGIALAMTAPLYALLRYNIQWLWLPILISLALLFTTHRRLPVWIDEQNFHKANIDAEAENWRAQYNLAMLEYKQGNTTQALEIALGSLRNTNHEDTALLVGLILIEQNNLTSATSYLEKVQINYPDSPRPFAFAGHIAYLEKNTTVALNYYEEALKRDSSNPQYLFNISTFAHELGETTRALSAAERFFAIEPDNTSAIHLKDLLITPTTAQVP